MQLVVRNRGLQCQTLLDLLPEQRLKIDVVEAHAAMGKEMVPVLDKLGNVVVLELDHLDPVEVRQVPVLPGDLILVENHLDNHPACHHVHRLLRKELLLQVVDLPLEVTRNNLLEALHDLDLESGILRCRRVDQED